jgi:hypothetical protein
MLSVLFFKATDTLTFPLIGGELYTYQSDFSTPMSTYTDGTGQYLATNPIILDVYGTARIYAEEGSTIYVNLLDANGIQQLGYPTSIVMPSISGTGGQTGAGPANILIPGPAGPPGQTGATGTNGTNGSTGPTGAPGSSSLNISHYVAITTLSIADAAVITTAMYPSFDDRQATDSDTIIKFATAGYATFGTGGEATSRKELYSLTGNTVNAGVKITGGGGGSNYSSTDGHANIMIIALRVGA